MNINWTSILFAALTLPALGASEELVRPEIPAPVLTKAPENTILGMTQKAFVEAQSAIADAQSDAEVTKLTLQIEALIAQRDKLMVAIAARKRPEIGDNIKVIGASIEARRQKAQ